MSDRHFNARLGGRRMQPATLRVAADPLGGRDGAGGGGTRTVLTKRALVHAGVIALALAPLAWLAQGALLDGLGANPVETITHTTGDWALRCLLACLAITPLRRVSPRLAALAPFRRTFGLLAFLYAVLHASTFFALDLGFVFASLAEEIAERPYVTLGFAALVLMTPLAVTSTRRWQRRLGRRWLTLHKLAYVAAALAVAHFLWLVKADLREPLAYAALLAALLAARVKRGRSVRKLSCLETEPATLPPRPGPPTSAARPTT